ncbi:hypothetical protein QP257_25245, partial [Escherichia coli]|nr:hypothetical protein [Escherichia coli]
DGIVLRLCEPQVVFLFYCHLASDILAAKWLIGGYPGCGIAIPLLLIGGAIDGQEVEGVIGKVLPNLGRELLCPLLPGVA